MPTLDRLTKAFWAGVRTVEAGASVQARRMVLGLDVFQGESGLKTADGTEAKSSRMRVQGVSLQAPCARVSAWLEYTLTRWHLLSLDAPTVAVAWTWFVARCARVDLPAAVLAAMFVAVWLLYATDRLLDGRAQSSGRERELEERHRFHWAHRRAFGIAIAAAGVALVLLVVTLAKLPLSAFWPFVGLGCALAAWFGLIHLVRPLSSLRGAKELVPGLFFGAAVFLPTLVRAPALRPWLEESALAFGLVCWLNCRLIDRWEHEGLGSWTSVLSAALGVFSAGLAAVRLEPMTPVLLAVSLAAAGLLWLDRVRGRLERTTLRAAADLVLLTPLIVVAWVR